MEALITASVRAHLSCYEFAQPALVGDDDGSSITLSTDTAHASEDDGYQVKSKNAHGPASEIGQQARGSVSGSLRDILFSSWLNILLIFVPIGFMCPVAGMGSSTIFAANAVAIVPLSALLTNATERVAAHAGDAVGALLNISLGNLVELILFIVALAHGHVRMVEASILGSVLVNLLLILGSALLVGSTVNSEPTYNTARAQLLACLLFVSMFTFLMPTAFESTFHDDSPGPSASLQMSRISSLVILAIYVVYLAHEIQLPSRHGEHIAVSEFDKESNYSTANHCQPHSSTSPRAHAHQSQTLCPWTVRLADEETVRPTAQLHVSYVTGSPIKLEPASPSDWHKDDDTLDSRGRQGGSRHCPTTRASSRQPLLQPRKHSPSLSIKSNAGRMSRDSSAVREIRKGFSRSSLTTVQYLRESHLDRDLDAQDTQASLAPRKEVIASIFMLILASVLMSVNAELLVGTIDDVTSQTKLSESVIGIIVLPIIGNIAEYSTVVSVAARDKLDLAIAVAVGSSIQIALCVTPLTVIAGWILHQDLALTFSFFEMATLLGAVLLVNLLVLHGSSSSFRTGGLKGALMCACYLIIGLGAYCAPQSVV